MSFKTKFSNLGHPNRIWTLSAIHGDVARLQVLHGVILDRFQPGDRLVYTGNYFAGHAPDAAAAAADTMDALLDFRRRLLAHPGMVADDIVYLRGTQEELWRHLQQLQFAPGPRQLAEWIATHQPEMDALLRMYGTSLDEALKVSTEGTMNLTRWSSQIKARIRASAGHSAFFTLLRRAAFTENRYSNDNNILIVHAGLNPDLPLVSQGDQFWWSSGDFNGMQQAYHPFRAVVRGHDPEHRGVFVGPVSVSLDGGCGYGGQLICGQLSDTGQVLDIIAA